MEGPPSQNKDADVPTSLVRWRPRRCPVCHVPCTSSQFYHKHVQKHGPNYKEISCPKCKSVFKSNKCLKQHYRLSRCWRPPPPPVKYEPETGDKCETCGSTFATNELLQNHKTFERCIVRKIQTSHFRNKSPRKSLGETESGRKTWAESIPDDDTVCPVATCRRSFKTWIRKTRNWHILKVHATWDGKCVMCGESFDLSKDDIFDHMKEVHGSQDTFYEENLVRVKTEEILEDVKIKVEEPQVVIKQEVVSEMESGEHKICVDNIKQEICNVKIKQEICDVKCEPDQTNIC